MTTVNQLGAVPLVEQLFGAVIDTLGVASVHLGGRLGFYRALADAGAATPGELAARTGTAERYVRESLEQQAVAGFVPASPTSMPACGPHRPLGSPTWPAARPNRASPWPAPPRCRSTLSTWTRHRSPAVQTSVVAAGLTDRVRPVLHDASDPDLGGSYELVTIFEALHDMNHPVEALQAARASLAEGGSVVIADERVAERFSMKPDRPHT